jgi:hypothetical protein
MRHSTILRACVVLEWVLFVLYIALSFALADNLPAELRAWQDADAERHRDLHEWATLATGLLCLLAAFVASVGLLFLQRWAAWLYLASKVVEYLVYPFSGPTVEHALADTAEELGILVSGAILALAFFSEALRPSPPVATPLATEDRAAEQAVGPDGRAHG